MQLRQDCMSHNPTARDPPPAQVKVKITWFAVTTSLRLSWTYKKLIEQWKFMTKTQISLYVLSMLSHVSSVQWCRVEPLPQQACPWSMDVTGLTNQLCVFLNICVIQTHQIFMWSLPQSPWLDWRKPPKANNKQLNQVNGSSPETLMWNENNRFRRTHQALHPCLHVLLIKMSCLRRLKSVSTVLFKATAAPLTPPLNV